jgi:uncharacterized membrane protein
MIAVDVLIAELWMALLIYGAGYASQIDAKLKAQNTSINEIKDHLEKAQLAHQRIPLARDFIYLLAISLGATGLAHGLANQIVPYLTTHYPALEKYSLTSTFFWVVSLVTLFGVLASLTPLRKLENAGASKLGSVFLYILVATIGMQMELGAVTENPGLFVIGFIWMLVHAIILIAVARLLKIPFFFAAVASQACVGGTASAPVVAAAFHPSLASVGVLLAIFGYAVGTYGGYLTGLMMQWVSNQ